MRMAESLIEERITEACLPNRRDHLCVRACACAWLSWRPRMRADPCEPFLSVGVDRVWLRRAGVRTRVGVQREHRRVEYRKCHNVVLCMRRLFGPAACHRRDALGRSSMWRGRFCAAAPPMRPLVCELTHVQAFACAGVHLGRAYV
jgi:hypothetical protein